MAYNRSKIFEQAKEIATSKKLFFVEDIVALLPCSKATFYDFFPLNSDELNEIKDILDANRVTIKSSMRSKWYNSDHPTLQIALYKIIGSEEESHRLNGSHHKLTGADGEDLKINAIFNIDLLDVSTDDSD